MNRFRQAVGVGFVFTVSTFCFVFAFEVFSALMHNTSMLQALVDTVVSGALFYAFITFSLFEFYRFIDERNRIDAEDKARRDQARDETERKDSDDGSKLQFGEKPDDTGRAD